MPSSDRPRRRDREVRDADWIRSFLQSAPIGVLAIQNEKAPYLNPNLFVYLERTHSVYVHTSASGSLPSVTASGKPGSFTAFTMGRVLPAKRAMDFSAEYASVVAMGEVGLVRDDEEKTEVLSLLMHKYAPGLKFGVDYEGITPRDLALTAVHRLRIDQWTAKRNVAPEDFPGAFAYPGGRGD